MKLISCKTCGCVIDTDRIPRPDAYHYDTGESTSESKWDYDEGKYMAIISCPCCNTDIFYHNGNIS
jgi:hypothetical protein